MIFYLCDIKISLSYRCVVDRFFAETPRRREFVPCTNGWKVHASYNRLNELAPVIFVTKGKNN